MKASANNFALSDGEDKTPGPWNRAGIADLPMLRTLLAIHQKSREPSFWEVMDSFVLLAYASLPASRTLLQQLLACLNFTLDSEDLFCWHKKSDFFELWQQHKQLKTMEMNIYINPNLHPFTKFSSSSRSTEFKDILPWNISQMIMKAIPVSTRIVISYAMKQGIPL